MTVFHSVLAFLSFASPPQGATTTIEGTLLGYDGGNRVGVYRLLVGNRVELVSRTGVTQFDETVLRLRFRIGEQIRVQAVDSGDEPSARSRLTAQSVKVLRLPNTEWQILNGRMDDFVRSFAASPDDCRKAVRVSMGLDRESQEALLSACRDRVQDSTPDALGIMAWTVAEWTQGGFSAVINPVIFSGKSTLTVQVEKSPQGTRIRRVIVVSGDTYWTLFGRPADH